MTICKGEVDPSISSPNTLEWGDVSDEDLMGSGDDVLDIAVEDITS